MGERLLGRAKLGPESRMVSGQTAVSDQQDGTRDTRAGQRAGDDQKQRRVHALRLYASA